MVCGPFHSRGILTTPPLSSSNPEKCGGSRVLHCSACLDLWFQRVLKATAWEYSAFVLKARSNMEGAEGGKEWDLMREAIEKWPRHENVKDRGTLSTRGRRLPYVPWWEFLRKYMVFIQQESLLSCARLILVIFRAGNTRYWRFFYIYVGEECEGWKLSGLRRSSTEPRTHVPAACNVMYNDGCLMLCEWLLQCFCLDELPVKKRTDKYEWVGSLGVQTRLR